VVPVNMTASFSGTTNAVICTLGVTYAAHITGAPSIKVTRMVLKVNGETWADSGAISVSDFTNTTQKQVALGQTYAAQVIVSTSDGSTNTGTASLAVPARPQ
jgi:hypothetical protein